MISFLFKDVMLQALQWASLQGQTSTKSTRGSSLRAAYRAEVQIAFLKLLPVWNELASLSETNMSAACEFIIFYLVLLSWGVKLLLSCSWQSFEENHVLRWILIFTTITCVWLFCLPATRTQWVGDALCESSMRAAYLRTYVAVYPPLVTSIQVPTIHSLSIPFVLSLRTNLVASPKLVFSHTSSASFFPTRPSMGTFAHTCL